MNQQPIVLSGKGSSKHLSVTTFFTSMATKKEEETLKLMLQIEQSQSGFESTLDGPYGTKRSE